jgi:hypothetical protein
MSRTPRFVTNTMPRLRALTMSARQALAGAVATLASRASSESRRRRLAWVAATAVLVLVPLCFNLARAPNFKASVELFPRAVGPYPAVTDPAYYQSFLNDPELRQQMTLNVGRGVAGYGDVTITPHATRNTVVVTVAAPEPANAQRFVNALGLQIAGATQRQLGRQADREAVQVRARLRTRLPRSERVRLRRKLRRLERFGPLAPVRVLPGKPADRPPLDRWADRLVADLPGSFPGRPNPAWAALAGFLVAGSLWAIFLVLMPPRSRAPEASLPQPD